MALEPLLTSSIHAAPLLSYSDFQNKAHTLLSDGMLLKSFNLASNFNLKIIKESGFVLAIFAQANLC